LHRKTALFLFILLIVAAIVESRRTSATGNHVETVTEPDASATAVQPAILNGPAAEELKARSKASFGKLNITFEENRGQSASEVKFLYRGSGYSLFMTPDEAVLSLPASKVGKGSSGKQNVLRLRTVGSRGTPEVSGNDEQASRSNYFIGSDPTAWKTDVPHFGKVKYSNVYAGIDQIFYGNQGQLEYDFVVSPGADPGVIRLNFDGAKRTKIDGDGSLVITLADGGDLRQSAPVTYQYDACGGKRSVESRYVTLGPNEFGFEIGDYDRNAELIIDPILFYSTFLGGSGSDQANGIAVDSAGNAYIAGWTSSTNFPRVGAIQNANAGTDDAFVAKLNPAGTALVYSTYIGGGPVPGQGSSKDRAYGLAIDSTGNAYIVGETSSYNFPVVNAFQPTMAQNTNPDGFITKINASGSALVYSSYLGGAGSFEWANAVAVDSAGAAYITGFTGSPSFPVVNAIQPTYAGGVDAFVAKVAPSGTSLVYSTYLGGSNASGNGEVGNGIAVDSAGSVYVTGHTNSTNFPLMNAQQGSLSGPTDAFVTKINPAGTAFVFSTYLGGSAATGATGDETGYGIAVDSSGNVYVTGSTTSNNFPTLNPAQGTRGGSLDAFLTKYNAAGVMQFSTYHGGDFEDIGRGVVTDSAGNAHIVGNTFQSFSPFPLVDPIQTSCSGSRDIFVARFTPAGTRAFSTCFGGTSDDFGRAIAVDADGDPYVAGYTLSTNNIQTFAIGGAPVQATTGGGEDAFVLAIESVTPRVRVAAQPGLSYTENFDDILTWQNNFVSPTDARVWRSVPFTETGTIPDGKRTSQSTAIFQPAGSSAGQSGLYRGGEGGNPAGTIVLLAASATENTSALAIDLAVDYTGVNAGTLSFDWASVNNSTGNRRGSLRVYTSTDGTTFTELTGAAVLNYTNNSPTSGSVTNVQLPASFNNSPNGLIRFYAFNGTGGGTTGSRPKISFDNVTVTAAATGPSPTPTGTATPSPSPSPTAEPSISGVVTYGTTPAGQGPRFVPGVMLAATGPSPVNSGVTNAAGAYTLTGFGAGAYTVTPSKSGDVNASVSGLDAARVAQHVAGLITLTANQQIAGDATNNGALSGLDAARIAQYAAGLTNPGIAGQWKFIPASRNYPSVSAPVTNENYEAILVGEVTGNWTAPAARPNGQEDADFDADYAPGLEAPSLLERKAAYADHVDAVAVSLPTKVASSGDGEVVIPISIGDTTGRGVLAYEFTILYDAESMIPIESAADAAGTLSEGWTIVHNARKPGQLTVTAFNTAPLAGEGTLLNLRFKSVGTKGREPSLKWAAIELNEGEIAAKPLGGKADDRADLPFISDAGVHYDLLRAIFGE
jgi:hypothetical protein